MLDREMASGGSERFSGRTQAAEIFAQQNVLSGIPTMFALNFPQGTSYVTGEIMRRDADGFFYFR